MGSVGRDIQATKAAGSVTVTGLQSELDPTLPSFNVPSNLAIAESSTLV